MSTHELVLTTGHLNTAQREQVLSLWQRHDVTLPDPELRLSEVRGLAIDAAGQTVGVCTAGLVTDSITKQRFLTLRSFTDEAHRTHHIALQLVYEVGQALHAAFIEKPQGSEVGAILQYENSSIIRDSDPMQADLENNPGNPLHTFMAGFCRVGYDTNNALCNLCYYQDTEIVPPRPDLLQAPASADKTPHRDAAGHDVIVRMNGLTEEEQSSLIDFWQRMQIFPSDAAMLARLPHVRALVFHDGRLIGSASVVQEAFSLMRTNIHRVRVFLAPGHRGGSLLSSVVKVIFAAYEEEWINQRKTGQPAGMTYWINAADITKDEMRAVHTANNFWCAGFDDRGNMRRLHWFRGANLGHVRAALKVLPT